ncbi:uncharacterized protein [Pyrus communis]|uniref:uncharacterized protein isoform X2 n=1 Tax=Pyrus communis TaxID=23211 RepID=UPI0035C0FD30
MDPKFVKKSAAGKKVRELKKLLHHSGSMPFSYRLEARHQGVLSSQRSTCSKMFTFDLVMRPLSSFMLLWWKRALMFSKKQHRNFPRRPRLKASRYPRMHVFRSWLMS